MRKELKKSWQRLAARLRRLIGRDHPLVAVVRLNGVITSAPIARRGSINLASLAESLEIAFGLPRVKAVALSINSPGGAPVQSAMLHERIRALAKEKKMPVYAFTEDVAASGGYWLALAADEIYADQNSIVGSVGVIAAGFGFTGLIEKLGVERRLYTAGKNKSMLDPFLPEKSEDIERLRGIQDEIHQSFGDLVRSRRADRIAEHSDEILFNGDVWTGRRAHELGLIDGIADLRGMMREKFGEKVRFRVIGPKENWLQRRLGLGDAEQDAAERLIDRLEQRALWGRFGL